MSVKLRVAIIGGGVSGVSAAKSLAILSRQNSLPLSVTLFEANDRLGGNIWSLRIPGKLDSVNGHVLIDSGANTFVPKHNRVVDFLESFNGFKDAVYPSLECKRFTVRDGRLIPFPESLLSFLTTPLLSFHGKFRFVQGLFKHQRTWRKDDSVSEFFGRRFGTEMVDYMINPFVSGVFAGNPSQLSMKHSLCTIVDMEQRYSSLLGLVTSSLQEKILASPKERTGSETYSSTKMGAARKWMITSFSTGLNGLIERLLLSLESDESSLFSCCIKKSSPIKYLCMRKEGLVDLALSKHSSLETFDHVIWTAPSHVLQSVDVRSNDKNFQNDIMTISSIPYAPISLVSLGFLKTQVDKQLKGFGLLIPEVEINKFGYKTLGTLFASEMFPFRYPQDINMLASFVGGGRQPTLAGLSDNDLIDMVCRDHHKLFGLHKDAKPCFKHVQRWSKGIPQYLKNHDNSVEAADRIEKITNNVMVFGGNFLHGVGLPDAILSGITAAEKVCGKTISFESF